jgi:hypothetical protein
MGVKIFQKYYLVRCDQVIANGWASCVDYGAQALVAIAVGIPALAPNTPSGSKVQADQVVSHDGEDPVPANDRRSLEPAAVCHVGFPEELSCVGAQGAENLCPPSPEVGVVQRGHVPRSCGQFVGARGRNCQQSAVAKEDFLGVFRFRMRFQ